MIKIISKLTFYIVVGAGVLGILSFGADKFNLALAQNIDDSGISYPIKELDNCASKSECKTYCDKETNQGACLDFAGQNGMMKKTEIEIKLGGGVNINVFGFNYSGWGRQRLFSKSD